VLNIFNILQNLFIWNNALTNILDSELCVGNCVSHVVVTQACGGVRGP
jgi:hypothetical protein